MGNLVLAGSGLVKGEDGLWIKLASVPLFILMVVVTKIYIDNSRQQRLILTHLLLAADTDSFATGRGGVSHRVYDSRIVIPAVY